jgi:putative sporulation protein YtaF
VVPLLLALAVNLDNFGVGVRFGWAGAPVPRWENLWIAAVAWLGTSLAGLAGVACRRLWPPVWCDAAGALLITAVGIWVLIGTGGLKGSHQRGGIVLRVLKDPSLADLDASGDHSWLEATLLGTALSLNAWAGGLAAGLLGQDVALVSVAVAFLSYLTLWAGGELGARRRSHRLGERVSLLAACLLIAVGLAQLL